MIRELPDSKGYNAVLMVVDCLSKQIHAIPTVTSLDSTGVARLFLEHVWCHHRLPEEVISDCGPAFVSNFSHDLATLLGVKLTPSTSYHPQTDGQMECVNQEICHAPSWLNPGEPSHMHIHLTTDCDPTQLNALPCVGNVEYSPTWTSPGRQGQRIDSVHTIFIHLAYNTLCFM